MSRGEHGGGAERDGSDIKRRTYLRGVAAAGGAVVVGGLAATSSAAAQEGDGVVMDDHYATLCGTAAGGAGGQVVQCRACIAAQEGCDEEDVSPLYPIYTGLSGHDFTPEQIPEGAEYVTLKAGRNCYVTSVDDATTFSIPPGSPEISNATFYNCGGEPTPAVVDVDVTCDVITVTTENVDEGTALDATVTFIEDEVETDVEFDGAVDADGAATFDISGDDGRAPTYLVVSLGDTVLFDGNVTAADAPCGDDPVGPVEPEEPEKPGGKIDGLEITCDSVALTTSGLAEGATLNATVTYVGGLQGTYEPAVGDDGMAVIPLPGDFDPAHLLVEYDGKTLYDANVQATDAPCAAAPKPPEHEKERRKLKRKMRMHKRQYRKYKKRLEKTEDHEKKKDGEEDDEEDRKKARKRKRKKKLKREMEKYERKYRKYKKKVQKMEKGRKRKQYEKTMRVYKRKYERHEKKLKRMDD